MLDRLSETRAGGDVTPCRDCPIQLPESAQADVGRTGLLEVTADDRRRFPRRYFRTCARLKYRTTFPSLPRPPQRVKVCTRDLGRGGLSFYHREQLFPREVMSISFADGTTLAIEIVCCLRVQQDCFKVGVRFTKQRA